jgi:hypothetical protein
MTYLTRKHISRRTLLRGAGVTLALPFLDSMVPAQTPLAKAAANPKTRFVGIFAPHGWARTYCYPEKTGPIAEMPFIFKPLEAFKSDVTIVSGLDAKSSMPPPGTSGGDHSRASASLTGAPPKKTAGADIYCGTSVDQIIAQKLGQDTLLPSIQLAIEDPGANTGICGWGYSCAYSNSVSWAAPNKPLPHEINPSVVFERLFGDGATPEERAARKLTSGSILDAVHAKVTRFQKMLPAADRARLNDYLEDIRELERRLQIAVQRSAEAPSLDVPFGVPESFDEHIKLFFDLQALAFQGDITRVSSLMYARDVSLRSYPESGVNTANHPASHHGEDPKRREDYAKINRYHQLCLAYFLDKLKKTPDGDGNLLDHSLILWASNMGNANQHSHVDAGHLLIGGAAGKHKGGKHVRDEGQSTANLLLTALHMFGIERDSIGDSTGTVAV